ncbi:hypothetical protein [Photobacterium leiognathi]|uniref:hypothetical protein n=1 Tax=Photobacterium leiognathi TaxID=553611 RepID=UPI0029819BA1|nr:hypothetical protein [Photobacterium leiognathi]
MGMNMERTVNVFITAEGNGYEAVVESAVDDFYIGTEVGRNPEQINDKYCADDKVSFRNPKGELIVFPPATRKSRSLIGLPVYNQKLKLLGTVAKTSIADHQRWLHISDSDLRLADDDYHHYTAAQGAEKGEHLLLK